MFQFTIIWTLFCAVIIIGYSLYLNKKATLSSICDKKGFNSNLVNNSIELISFDLQNEFPGMSCTLNVPEITDDVLKNYPILFYVKMDNNYRKLPLVNSKCGYTAIVYKNTGKIYLVIKSLADSVSNYYLPAMHLDSLKILIIKSRGEQSSTNWGARPNKLSIFKELAQMGIDIDNYDEVLGYFSNMAKIEFKGHFTKSEILFKSV
tara:strand:+ start:3544 stop:4161 length:618 start_codon:yes stop_codon:yes gene_type:complete